MLLFEWFRNSEYAQKSWLIRRIWAHRQKLIVSQLVQKFATLCVTPSFIALLTKAHSSTPFVSPITATRAPPHTQPITRQHVCVSAGSLAISDKSYCHTKRERSFAQYNLLELTAAAGGWSKPEYRRPTPPSSGLWHTYVFSRCCYNLFPACSVICVFFMFLLSLQ